MDARRVQQIEAVVEASAAVTLAAAAGFVAVRLDWSWLAIGGAALGVLLICHRGLRSIGAWSPSFPIAPFELAPLPSAPPELLLVDRLDPGELLLEDQLDPADGPRDEAVLTLDDVLTSLGHDSRVVRLFDPAAMPSPGQLKERIDRHLGNASPASADASKALHDALAELRRSLR